MATYSRILAWRIPWREEPGGLPSMGSHRVGHDWSNLAAAVAAGNKWKINSICCSPGIVGGFSWRMHHLNSLHCSFSSLHIGSRQKDTCTLMEDVSKVLSLVEFVFLVLHPPVLFPISCSFTNWAKWSNYQLSMATPHCSYRKISLSIGFSA